MEEQEILALKKKFYEWVWVAIDEMPKRDYTVFNDMESLPLNLRNDIIYLYLGNHKKIWMFIKSKEKDSSGRTERMLDYSNEIQNRLSDQKPFGDKTSIARAKRGWSIRVQRNWTPYDQNEWPHVVYWIRVQFKRLKEIIVDLE